MQNSENATAQRLQRFMKKLFQRALTAGIPLLSIIAAEASAQNDFSLSFIGAAPDPTLPFVSETLGSVIPGTAKQTKGDENYANDIYWTLHAMGLSGIDAYPVLVAGATDGQSIIRAIENVTAGSEQGIVFMTLGPQSAEMCARMAASPQFVFLLTSGFSGSSLDRSRSSACNAQNILTAAPLDPSRTTLYASANYGESVNFAVPSFFGELPNPRNVSPLTRSSVCAFAELAAFAQSAGTTSPDWVESFESGLAVLPGLSGKTKMGRAILKCADDTDPVSPLPTRAVH